MAVSEGPCPSNQRLIGMIGGTVRPGDSTVPLFPTARLHVDAAVTRSLAP